MGRDASSFVSRNHYFKSGVQKRDPNALLAACNLQKLTVAGYFSPGSYHLG
jgi:hypothetical protein